MGKVVDHIAHPGSTSNPHTVTPAQIGAAETAHTHDDLYFTEAEVTISLATKQDALVSGTNIKTINGGSILGSGDIVISGGGGGTPPSNINLTNFM